MVPGLFRTPFLFWPFNRDATSWPPDMGLKTGGAFTEWLNTMWIFSSIHITYGRSLDNLFKAWKKSFSSLRVFTFHLRNIYRYQMYSLMSSWEKERICYIYFIIYTVYICQLTFASLYLQIYTSCSLLWVDAIVFVRFRYLYDTNVLPRLAKKHSSGGEVRASTRTQKHLPMYVCMR